MKKIYCNICGEEIKLYDDLCSFNQTMGYQSKHDGEIACFDICAKCMDKLIESCKISPLDED